MKTIKDVTFEDLYNMKPHETIGVDSGSLWLQILRVPHGWNYTYMNLEFKTSCSVFVPFVNSKGEE